VSFVVMDRQTKSSRAQWSRSYRRLAVVEMDDDWLAVERMRAAIFSDRLPPTEPARIDRRAKGVIRIVETWEHLNKGLTARSAYHRAMTQAVALCHALNAAEAHAEWTAGGRLDREF
jgi:hypothetical protein